MDFTKDYNTVLTETANFFASNGVSIIGEGYKEIATNPALFESYVDQLTESCSADDAATMAQLMQNTNQTVLKETSLTGIQPIHSLAMPVIRKLWPKFALKDAIKTEVAKTPRLVIPYTKPYMFTADANGDEKRVYLPYGLKEAGVDAENSPLSKTFVTANATVTNGAAVVVGAGVTTTTGTGEGAATTTTRGYQVQNTPSAIKTQPYDELRIESVTLTKGGQTTNVKIGKKLDLNGNGIYAIDENGAQLVVNFQGAKNRVTYALVGAGDGASVTINAKFAVSTEYNEESWSVGFDIATQDFEIPSGQHINAPLPIEALNDMMALYQIDGTKETVDLMTNVFAYKLDKEILDFFTKSFINQPGNEAYSYLKQEFTTGDQTGGYDANSSAATYADDFFLSFDCKPAVGFAGSPKAWREELKPLIDHLAQRVKNHTYLQAGKFTIVANPIDVQLLANVDWSFRGGQGGNIDGVTVDYSVGTYVGANAYTVIASTNVKPGAMYIVFTPASDTQLTYKYYPYTFSTEMGYVDPNRSRVPSIMMTKRHAMVEFMPAIGLIEIKNNDGKSYFRETGAGANWQE